MLEYLLLLCYFAIFIRGPISLVDRDDDGATNKYTDDMRIARFRGAIVFQGGVTTTIPLPRRTSTILSLCEGGAAKANWLYRDNPYLKQNNFSKRSPAFLFIPFFALEGGKGFKVNHLQIRYRYGFASR